MIEGDGQRDSDRRESANAEAIRVLMEARSDAAEARTVAVIVFAEHRVTLFYTALAVLTIGCGLYVLKKRVDALEEIVGAMKGASGE